MPPYFKSLSFKLVDKSFLTRATALNLVANAESGVHVVFVDDLVPVVELAREVVKAMRNPEAVPS